MFKNLIDKIQENYFVSFIYLYILLMPWNFSNAQMGVLSIILLIWWLILGKENNYFSRLKNIFKFKPLIILILFLLWSYLSLLWTEDFEWAKISLKYYKYYWIIIPIIFTTLSEEEAKNTFYIFIVSLGIYALFSLSIAIGIIDIIDCSTSPNCQSNPRGILPYAIVSPYMAIATLSAGVIAFYTKSKNNQRFFTIISIFSFMALCINNGRAGQLAFLITLIILFLLYWRQLFNFKFIFAFLFIIILSIGLLTSSGKLNRMTNAFQELQDIEKKEYSGSFGMRAYLCKAGIALIPNHPIVGAGAGDNINEFILYTETHPSNATWLRSYHNQHLDTLTKYGIIGYLLLWGSVFSLLYSLRKKKKYFTLALIFFSITFFDSLADILLLMKPFNNIFILVFLLFSIISFSKKESN